MSLLKSNSTSLLYVLTACLIMVNLQTTLADPEVTKPDNSTVQKEVDNTQHKLTNRVRNFYQGEGFGAFYSLEPKENASLLSKHLLALVEQNRKKYDDLFIGFDPIVNGQDALITELEVCTAQVSGNNATVRASFKNFEHDITLIYSFVLEDSVWKLDEMASVSGDFRWLLSDVIRNP